MLTLIHRRRKRVLFRVGPEHKGKVVVIVQASNGLKSSGERFRKHMAKTLWTMGTKSMNMFSVLQTISCLEDGIINYP